MLALIVILCYTQSQQTWKGLINVKYMAVYEVRATCFSAPFHAKFRTETDDEQANEEQAIRMALAAAMRKGLSFDRGNSTASLVSLARIDQAVNTRSIQAPPEPRLTSCILCGYVYEGRRPKVCQQCGANTDDGTRPGSIDI